MDLIYSEKFKDYIEEQEGVGYPQTIYKFPNGYGASVIKFKHNYFSIAGLRFDKNGDFGIDYRTPITNNVIVGLNEKGIDEELQRIFDLEKIGVE